MTFIGIVMAILVAYAIINTSTEEVEEFLRGIAFPVIFLIVVFLLLGSGHNQ
jgi:uncharacterized integral membrane protein